MSDDKIRSVWSDVELDAALASMHDDVRTDGAALATGRTALLTAATLPELTSAGSEPRSGAHGPWWRWSAAAAAVLALTVGGAVVQTMWLDRGPGLAAAATELDAAAARALASDRPLRPGQYRYVAVHQRWDMVIYGGRQPQRVPLGQRREVWIPFEERDVWLQRTDQVLGPERYVQDGDVRARCGRFRDRPLPPGQRCPAGSWLYPTDVWIAGLPRDPDRLYERLRADATALSASDEWGMEMLTTAIGALRSGRLPAERRAALYRALAKVPGLVITDRAANLDGRIGVAYGIEGAKGGVREEALVDPRNGEYIGSRWVAVRAGGGFPAGHVLSFSAVSAAVVDSLGSAPRR